MPDWDYVAAQQELAAQLQPFFEFFESDKNLQVNTWFKRNFFDIYL